MLPLFLPRYSVRPQGFELEFDPVVARLFSACKDSAKLDHAVRSLVERYLSVEDLFAGKANEDGVIADLIKAHKDDPEVRAVADSCRCCCCCCCYCLLVAAAFLVVPEIIYMAYFFVVSIFPPLPLLLLRRPLLFFFFSVFFLL